MPVNKTTRSKAPAASKKSPSPTTVRTKTAAPSKRSSGAGAMLVVAMCVTGAVIVIAAREMKPATRTPVSEARVVDPELTTAASKTTAPRAVTTPLPAPPVTADSADAKTSAANPAPVTIFGCLERSNDAYRLTDTDGADAPRSRSWKTAFLKKGSASVEVVDPGNRARLSTQVGHRVGVTGAFREKQLQVRSVRRISGSCGN